MRGPLILLSSDAAETISMEAPASSDGRETGGVLLGHDTGDHLLVTVAGGPGPNAGRRPNGFLRDLDYSRGLADTAYDRDRSIWLGEWHTHPVGPEHPSPIDMKTYGDLLADESLQFDRILSIIALPCPVHGWSELILRGWVISLVGDGLSLTSSAVTIFGVEALQ